MKCIINLAYLCTAILLYSCEDYSGGTHIMFANDSSHHIQMINFAWPDDDDYAAGIYISPGEKAHFKGGGFNVNDRTPLDADNRTILSDAINKLPRGATVIFDNQYAITYSANSEPTTLCYIENYFPTRISPTWWRYTYHFTDEDYEYAREHGEVIE